MKAFKRVTRCAFNKWELRVSTLSESIMFYQVVVQGGTTTRYKLYTTPPRSYTARQGNSRVYLPDAMALSRDA